MAASAKEKRKELQQVNVNLAQGFDKPFHKAHITQCWNL